MKKSIDEIISNLDAAQKARDEKQRKLLQELSEAQSKSEEIKTALESIEDPGEYKKLLKEKSENDSLIDFINARKPKSFIPAITKEELSEINRTVNSKIEDIQKDYSPKIQKEINKLVSLLDEYYAEASSLEAVKKRAAYLNSNMGSANYIINNLAIIGNDPLLYYEHICRAYLNHKQTVERIKAHIESGKPFSVGFSADDAHIFKELSGRVS